MFSRFTTRPTLAPNSRDPRAKKLLSYRGSNYLSNFGFSELRPENIRTGKSPDQSSSAPVGGGAVRKINPELWLLLFLVLIAAVLNFLVASQRMALVFYFLPTLYSAYHFGRRHATLTALVSVILVFLLVFTNPTVLTRHVELPFARWFDLALWGGVLMVAGYATGTLYERNQKTLREMEE